MNYIIHGFKKCSDVAYLVLNLFVIKQNTYGLHHEINMLLRYLLKGSGFLRHSLHLLEQKSRR